MADAGPIKESNLIDFIFKVYKPEIWINKQIDRVGPEKEKLVRRMKQ